MMTRKAFDEVVLFARTGLNPRTNFKLGSGNNKYITIKNIHNNRLVIDENTDLVDDAAISLIHKRSQIKKGDILFCSIGRMGDMYIIPDEPQGWDINESVFAFTVDTNLIRQKYFYYLFKNRDTIEYLSKNSSGSTFKSIKMNQLKKMVFELPTLDEQDRIVDSLDLVSSIIEKRENELTRLDELIKARFVEMFGDPINNTKHLPICHLGELGIWNSGGTPSRTNPEYFTGSINWYSAGELNSLYLHGSNEKITEEAIDNSATKLFKAGSMLVGMYDTAAFKMGILIEDSASNQACACIEPNNSIDIIWLYYALTLMKGSYLSQRRGVRQKNLNLGMIREFTLPIACIDEQKQFVSFVKQVNKSKFVVQKSLEEAQLLFDSLMQEYFG